LQNQKNPSPPVSLVEIFLKARELERNGKDVIHFDAGEPDYSPPQRVVDATIEALRLGKGRYTESGGLPEAKKSISLHLEKRLGVHVPLENILVTAGGRLALYLAFASLERKSKVGIISPDWPAYRDLARLLEYDVRFFRCRLDNDWDINLDDLQSCDCTTLVLNYPNNPTGKMLNCDTFDELVKIAADKKMTVISDEVYSSFIYGDPKRYKSVLETDNLRYIFVNSLSKDYAMTGFRAAYSVSDRETISQMSKVNGLIMTSAPEFVQYAIIAAMECDDYLAEKVALVGRRRDIAIKALREKLNAQVYVPDGSLYLFPRLGVKGQFDSEQFALRLLEEKFVSVSPGTTFGIDYKDHIRMTLLQDERRIEEGIQRMAELVQSV
jgi:aspartate aminotransferase